MVESCEKRARGDRMLPDAVIVSSRDDDREASPPLIGAGIRRLPRHIGCSSNHDVLALELEIFALHR
ncbi:hypothetical protein NL676_029767 [Syzygium grande]|nr:hypothetical protein NL676_029767 [Syzygium grande]